MSEDIYHPYFKANQSNKEKIPAAKNQYSIERFINFIPKARTDFSLTVNAGNKPFGS